MILKASRSHSSGIDIVNAKRTLSEAKDLFQDPLSRGSKNSQMNGSYITISRICEDTYSILIYSRHSAKQRWLWVQRGRSNISLSLSKRSDKNTRLWATHFRKGISSESLWSRKSEWRDRNLSHHYQNSIQSRRSRKNRSSSITKNTDHIPTQKGNSDSKNNNFFTMYSQELLERIQAKRAVGNPDTPLPKKKEWWARKRFLESVEDIEIETAPASRKGCTNYSRKRDDVDLDPVFRKVFIRHFPNLW